MTTHLGHISRSPSWRFGKVSNTSAHFFLRLPSFINYSDFLFFLYSALPQFKNILLSTELWTCQHTMAHKNKESDCMNRNLLLSTSLYIRGTTNLTLSDVFIRGDFNAATSSDPRKPWARRLLVVRCIDGDFDFSCSSDILGMDTRARGGSEGKVLGNLKSNIFFSIFSSTPITLTVSCSIILLHPNSHTLCSVLYTILLPRAFRSV